MGEHPPAQLRETHSAVVLLMGDRAYKIKKPVDLGFLDFSTPERRERACRRELAVNRRIAPDVYLGVASVRLDETSDAGRHGPGDRAAGSVPACEHVLVMRRMPDDRRLARLVLDGVDVRDDLRRLARLVAVFHASARTSPQIASCGSAAALETRWRDNLETLSGFALPRGSREVLGRVSRLALSYVDGRKPLLEARMAAGLIRDGHGDLLADDIFCLPDGPRALDALDFDDRLRSLDVLDDVACLAMDLERLDAAPLGAAFLRDYAEFSGIPHPDSLAHHYVAYRAVMRAKVTAIQQAQRVRRPSSPAEAPDERPGAPDPVRRLLDIGARHLHEGEVRLVVVGGGPASGKTTVAEALADRHDLAVLSSDRMRKEMLGLDPRVHRPAAYGAGIYRREVTERTYERLADQTERILGMGRSVVVDATFAADRHRRRLAEVGVRTRTPVSWVRCHPPEEVLRARLSRRTDQLDPMTDADASVAARLTEETDPWPGVVDLDTSRPLGECLDVVDAALAWGDSSSGASPASSASSASSASPASSPESSAEPSAGSR